MSIKSVKKYLLAGVFLAVSFLAGNSAYAEDAILVSNFNDLKTAIENAGTVKLDSDIAATGHLFSHNGTTIDLNGHTLDLGSYRLSLLDENVIKDSSANKTGLITGSSTYPFVVGAAGSDQPGKLTFESGNYRATGGASMQIIAGSEMTINGGNITSSQYTIYNNGGKLVINGGNVTSEAGIALYLVTNSLTVMNDGKVETLVDANAVNMTGSCTFIMNGGKVNALGDNGASVVGFKYANVIINGGELNSDSSALVGNGSVSGRSEGTEAKFTVTGGKITSIHGNAIYAPQPNGEVNISGGTFISNEYSVIEVRAGTLNITGGTFTSTGDNYSVVLNNSGATTKGAAVAIAQHNTKLPLNVTICGGSFNAAMPLSFTNPQGNPQTDIDKIHVLIDEPCAPLEFNGTDDTTAVTVIDNGDFVIKGGTYSKNVADYVADGYGIQTTAESKYIVRKYRNITIDDANGSTISTSRALKGDHITVTVQVPEGLIFSAIEVYNTQNELLFTTSNTTFDMPDEDIIIKINSLNESAIDEEIPPVPNTGDHFTIYLGLIFASIILGTFSFKLIDFDKKSA